MLFLRVVDQDQCIHQLRYNQGTTAALYAFRLWPKLFHLHCKWMLVIDYNCVRVCWQSLAISLITSDYVSSRYSFDNHYGTLYSVRILQAQHNYNF